MRISEKIANAIRSSSYFVAACGCRDVGESELIDIVSALVEAARNDSFNITKALESIHKYNPDTIAMSKSCREYSCEEYNPLFCNCFLPDVNKEDWYCTVKRKEYLLKVDHRKTPEYEKWRKNVFERDDYTCQECSERGGTLNAHHIKTFKDFPELRYNETNGVTLCVMCHRRLHSA